jgi:hypothetical protein
MGWREALNRIVDVAFGALLADDDDLTAVLRKVVLTILVSTGGTFIPLIGVYFVAALAFETDEAAVPALAVAAFTSLASPFTWHYSYWYCRATKDASNATTNVAAWGGVLWAAGILVALTQISSLLVSCTLLVGILIVDTNHRNAQLALTVAIFLCSLWNFNQASFPDAGMVAVPHARSGPMYERIVLATVSVAIFGYVVIGVFGMTVAARRAVNASESALQMSMTVAELLRCYDTDGVTEMLAEYQDAPGADPRIVASYTALVANLNRYRPHLPNWVVAPRRDGGSDSLSRPTSSQSTSRTGGHSPAQQPSQPSPGASLPDDPRTNVLVLPPAADGNSAVPPRNEHSASDAIDLDALLIPNRVASDVSFALIDFRAGEDLVGDSHAATISDFVDAVHHLATATQGALHGFVGDTVQVSWNAAMKTAQPEAKAARFVCRLKSTVAESIEHLSVAGAVMNGKAVSQFGGSGHVSAFVLSLPWRAKLLACFALARRHRAFVCSAGLAMAAGDAVVTRPVELLSVTQHAEESTVLAHEMVGLRTLSDTDDDWLYLQAHPQGKVAKPDPLQLCIDGSYEDALTALGSPHASESPLLANLRARAQAALSNPSRAFATRLCSCDDT